MMIIKERFTIKVLMNTEEQINKIKELKAWLEIMLKMYIML